ncbi:hypothetical protein ES708_02830 [subsurface metagenome]
MMIRSINSEILDNDTVISLKNIFFIKGKIKPIKLSSLCSLHKPYIRIITTVQLDHINKRTIIC